MPTVADVVGFVREAVQDMQVPEEAQSIRVRLKPSPLPSQVVAKLELAGARTADLLALAVETELGDHALADSVQVTVDHLAGDQRPIRGSRTRTLVDAQPRPSPAPSPEPHVADDSRFPHPTSPRVLDIEGQVNQAVALADKMGLPPSAPGAVDVRPFVGLLVADRVMARAERLDDAAAWRDERKVLLQTIKDRDDTIKDLQKELRTTVLGRDAARDELQATLIDTLSLAKGAEADAKVAEKVADLKLELELAKKGKGGSNKVDDFVKIAGSAGALMKAFPVVTVDRRDPSQQGGQGGGGQQDQGQPPAAQADGSATSPAEAPSAEDQAAQQLGYLLIAVVSGAMPPQMAAMALATRASPEQRPQLRALCEAILEAIPEEDEGTADEDTADET